MGLSPAGLCRLHTCSYSAVSLSASSLLPERNARHTSGWWQLGLMDLCSVPAEELQDNAQAPKAADEDKGQMNKSFI